MLKKFKSLGLGTRIISMTLTILLLVVAVNYVVFVTRYRASAEDAYVHKAAAFTAVADEAKNHTAALNRRGAFSLNDLLTDLEQTKKAGKPYTEAKIFGTIPVVAGWTAAEAAAKREHIDFHITSFDARNKANEPAPGSYEEQLLRDLTAQVNAGGEETIFGIDKATNKLHYMRAIRLTSDCLMCHGNPGNEYDTDKDGKDPVGFAMEGWKEGFMHGSYHVVLPLEPVDAQVAGFITNGLMWTTPLVIGAVILFVWLLRVMFNKPITELINRIKDIAQGEGDLTKRIEVNSQDEVGQLGSWFNTFVKKIHDVIVEVSGAANEVASAATQIAASSEEMASGMQEQSQQVTQISSAIEEMSASVVEVARKSGDAANNASNSGKMAEEGGTIVEQTIEGMKSISEAVSAGAASVQELGKRGEQIGQIIEVINDIADQTNLLALNAAIEAARAGEHGRGFAVVADEVRKLADRTTKATEEIATSIQAIQSETTQAVDRMNAGTDRVGKGVELASEAGQSLNKIVSSAQEVAGMIQSIAAAAEEQSAASEQVSRNVESISAVTRQATEGANQAATAATQLSTKAEQLQALVATFKTDASATRASNTAVAKPAARSFRKKAA
ncbi:MAG: DUF3365 domain-containing protein [Phycisphaera sp.]|nr:DUF3365 domain-containing protein [Phycisphaera sp.]